MTHYSSQDMHDDITELFDAYYACKASESLVTAEERNEGANALVEHYVDTNGKRPPNSVLSRLATYILLDTLSDSHPDKMTREEYPIMSYGQTGRYFARNGKLKDEPYEHAEVVGYAPGLDKDGKHVRNPIMNADNEEQRAEEWRLFIRGLLTEREATIIEMAYEDGATQAEIAEELGISSRWVREVHSNILDKLRELDENKLPIYRD